MALQQPSRRAWPVVMGEMVLSPDTRGWPAKAVAAATVAETVVQGGGDARGGGGSGGGGGDGDYVTKRTKRVLHIVRVRADERFNDERGIQSRRV